MKKTTIMHLISLDFLLQVPNVGVRVQFAWSFIIGSIFFFLQLIRIDEKIIHWPNLKNLSGGLNLSRGLNMVCST